MIGRLSWRNLWRNRNRSLITLSSVCFAVVLAVLMQSFQEGVFGHLVRNMVGFYTGSLQIHKAGYWNDQILDLSFAQSELDSTALNTVEGITAWVPRLESFMLASASNQTKGILVIGTDPEAEDRSMQLKSKITDGQYLDADDRAILLATGLASRLKLKTGDTLVLLGQGYQGSMAAGKYPIKGLLQFGAPDLNNNMLYMPLMLAQELLSAPGQLTSIAITLEDPEQLDDIRGSLVAGLHPGFEVMTWKEIMPEISDHIKADKASMMIFAGFLYLIIAFGLFGTVLMMTAERQREFGMLIAIGMKKTKLSLMLVMETLALSLLGVLTGIAISLPVMVYWNRNPIRLSGSMAEAYVQFGFEPLFPTSVDPQILIGQSSVVLILSLIISLYPIWFTFRLDPIESMKK
ncbi:MAG TPA: FtsX-like permease family protein [Saprospiraceae bacterium]|nr:FtsX-like permease family protein [Saprospiraceae bacterium]